MKINTGRGTILPLTLLGIWSISAMTSLPGLAVSPVLGKLDQIFPNTSDLEIQMLTSLPSLLIIPFVLLSGKLSESNNKLLILRIGLCIFLACGILYFFAKNITELILLSCVLGIGAGMIIPLSTGLITDFFVGEYRTKQLGISSAINNLTLVLATAVAGWLANYNWHLPFVVYLLPSIALVLSFFISPNYIKKEKDKKHQNTPNTIDSDTGQLVKPNKNYNFELLTPIIAIYYLATVIVLVISYNLPFLIQEYHYSSSYTGTITAIFFLAIMLPGLFLNKILKISKDYCIFYSFLCLTVGLVIMILFHHMVHFFIGVIFIGFGYGVVQPFIYDKTTKFAVSKKIYFALALVMASNYLAILTSPFITDFFDLLFHSTSQLLPFIIGAVVSAICAVLALIFRKQPIFSDPNLH